MKKWIKAAMDPDEVVDAIYNDKPFDFDSYQEYAQAFNDHDPDAIKAQDVRVGDVINNTESAEELDLGDVFVVDEIYTDREGWDYVFRIHVLTLEEHPSWELHFMTDEYVGVVEDQI